MMSRFVCLLFCGYIALNLGNTQKLPRVKRQSLKVQINVTDDTVCMRYLRPSQSTKLEGFVLGYGSNFFSNQYIPLPSEGKNYVTELDAEPRYLVSVRPARVSNNKKSCSGRNKTQKPLQLVVGTLTPTSVFLSWGILVNPQHDWTATSNCASDRFYTVRYREKGKDKKWVFQLCPATETVVDNLKPNTPYEFGVKDNAEDSVWSKTLNHKTVLSSKKVNGQLQNMYKLVPNSQTQIILSDNKKLVPVTIIKQIIQNRTQSKAPDSSSLPGAILVHLIVPGLNESQQKLPPLLTIDDIPQASRKKLAKNETGVWPAESKTPEVQEISPQSLPAQAEKTHGPEDFRLTPKPKVVQTQKIPASNEIQLLPSGSRIPDAPKSPLTELVTSPADLEKPMPPFSRTPHVLTTTAVFSDIQPLLSSPVAPSKPEIAEAGPAATSESILESFTPKTSRPFQWPRVTLAPKEMPLFPSKPKPSATPEVQHVKPAPKPPLLEPETSETVKRPKATLAPKEAKLTTSASKPRPSARPQKPRTKPATIPVSVTSRSPYTYERPKTAEAPRVTPRVPSKPKTSPKPHVPQVKDVPRGPQYVPSKPRTSPSPEVPRTRPASKDIYHRPSKPKISPSPRVPPTRASPKESRRVPSKPRASPSPDVPYTKPAVKEPQHIPFKPRATPIPDAPYRRPEILPTFDERDTTMVPHIPERTRAIFAPTEKPFIHTKRKTTERPRVPYTKPAIYPTTPQPIFTKSSTTTGQSRATMAPKEILLIPSKSKTSVGPEVPQAKPAPRATHLGSINLVTVHVVDGSKITLVPNETYLISPRPKIGQATEIPWFDTAPHKTRLTSARPQPTDKSQTRPAFSRTTLPPLRTKAPGLPKWIVPTADDFYTPEATARPIDMDVKRPPEYVDTWQRPISVTIPPGPQHPPIRPARPTPMRRKPLPPNTVTGKPGSPAKPAGPTPPVRTGTLYKTPTAFATPEYYVDATVFSSSPTSETDSSGKPRYQAPHVKYMKKDDDVPCSITSSLEHFPQEEVGSKEEPTRPPQNPPTNLTVVTVEGCPSFVILDWEKPDNDTVTEYEVVSTENGGSDGEKEKSIITTNQTHSTVENLKPDTSYEFHVKPRNPLGEGPSSNVVSFSTESADPRVSEPISMGKDAIWTEIPFNSDTYSECKGKQYVKRTWYKKFVGVQLCNSLRYKIYLSDSLTGKFYNIGDQRGHGEDHCQFVDSFLDGRTGQQEDLPVKDGFFRAVRQEPVKFGKIGGETQINYVRWYECGTSIPGKW
ncbi:target of Nesh-SH3 isoform X9 [Camarhynchus parvulus]|uniref:target of Nesh-SH3 isoform X9 n=1 Tax=Geospiza parvula TaxID=87175 RepID=UPI00123809A4|nr:target of Nesh-SH3 isoform X9 [Camarhynchus parvulus]